MIINNLEHVSAKTKKALKVLKGTLCVGISGVIISGGILCYSGSKEYDIDADFYTTHKTGWEILNGEAKQEIFETVTEYYQEMIPEKNFSHNNLSENSYDPSLPDSTIIDMDEDKIENIVWSLYDDLHYKDFVTIEDLKNVVYLDSIYTIEVNAGDDLSWLNYCQNLRYLHLELESPEALESLKTIESLNLRYLRFSVGNLYDEQGVNVNEEYFSFIKSCSDLKTLEIESPAFSLNSSFVNDVINPENEVELALRRFSSDSQKIDVDSLLNFKKITIIPRFNDGLYDIVTNFSREDINRLLEYDIEINIEATDENDNDYVVTLEEILPELNKIYDQIDEIITSLNIAEDMSEKEKLKEVLKYVLESLTYSESSKQIQEEVGVEGIKGNFFGYQNYNLVKDVKENSYKRGYLYGALNENGKPVCGSYAALTRVLLNNLGIEAYNMQSDVHSWNAVLIDGEYYFVDATALDTSSDILDLDEYLDNNKHLMTPAATNKNNYESELAPAGINLFELSDERRMSIAEASIKDYKVVLNGEVFVLSLSALIALLSILGMAISNEKLRFLESVAETKNEVLLNNEIDDKQKLMIAKVAYRKAKDYWRLSTPLEKAFLKVSKAIDFDEWQNEIRELRNLVNTQNKHL